MIDFFKNLRHTSNNRDRIFAGVVALVHVGFFLLACVFRRIYMGDSFEYVYEAINLRRFGMLYSGNMALPLVTDFYTQRQPLYPLFLFTAYAFSLSNWGVIVLQNLLSVGNVLIMRRFMLLLGYDRKNDWLLLILLVTYPAQFINANTIAPDILLQTFTLLYALYYCKFIQTKRIGCLVVMTIVLVAGFMVKPVLYPFALIHALLVAVTLLKLKIRIRHAVIAVVAPLLAVALYCSANYERTGKFHFSSNSAFNAEYYFYKYYSETQGKDSAERFIHTERQKIATMGSFSEQYNYASNRGLSLLRHHFCSYLVFHLRHSLLIFLEPGKAEMDLFSGKLSYGQLYRKKDTGFWQTLKTNGVANMSGYIRDNPSLIFAGFVLFFNIIRLVGFVLMLRDKQHPFLIKLFLVSFVLYFALLAGPISNTRYFLPVSLLLAGCSVLGWVKPGEK